MLGLVEIVVIRFSDYFAILSSDSGGINHAVSTLARKLYSTKFQLCPEAQEPRSKKIPPPRPPNHHNQPGVDHGSRGELGGGGGEGGFRLACLMGHCQPSTRD